MQPYPPPGPDRGSRAPEPIAIVGIAALYPRARGAEQFWNLLSRRETDCGCAAAGPGGGPDASGLDDLDVDLARFGIPPAQRGSLNRMQLLMLEAAARCLADAGRDPRRARPGERVDVLCAAGFGLDRQLANALRIEAVRYAADLEAALSGAHAPLPGTGARGAADELRELLTRRLGGSPHDRVGEMPSSIPARIAGAFKLHGRTVAVESADAGSFTALAAAVNSLRSGLAHAALVVAGHRRESALLEHALEAKGLIQGDAHPFTAAGYGLRLGEGVSALLLKPLCAAEREGDRIYALVRECALVHDGRPGVLRYSASVARRQQAAAAAHEAAGVPPASIQYLECATAGIARLARADIEALGASFAHRPPGSVSLGSAQDRLGHTMANAGLASVAKTALALHHRRLPAHAACAHAQSLDLSGTAFRFTGDAEPWPRPEADLPRRAAVVGSSFTGTLSYLLLDEYTPARAARPAGAGAPQPAAHHEPIAVIAAAGRFADTGDADEFWRAALQASDHISELPHRLLDRDLYLRPGSAGLAHTYTGLGAPVTPPEQPPRGRPIIPRRYAAMDPAQRLVLDVAEQLLAARGGGTAQPYGAGLRGRGLIVIGSTLSLSRERRAHADLALPEIEQAVRELTGLRGLSPDEREAVVKLVRERYAPAAEALGPVTLDGYLASGAAALIANEHRLDAVPMVVEAACASSLAALDIAVSALRCGAVDYAIAGGVELPCNTRDLVLCSALGLLSPTRITPFGEQADGFTPGDGCALFLLRRESDRGRDGQHALGLIRGCGASNDAKSLIAPDPDGQERALRQAFEQVDFDPGAVGYLEAHGTGTRVGDRVEIEATARVYGAARRTEPLHIGTAKAAFGHTFAAAGGAGLLRALYALHTATLPPTAGVRALNPDLGLDAIPADIPRRPRPWPG
ncbi:polyketide synthase, partial [Actinocrinis puniceicyclus]